MLDQLPNLLTIFRVLLVVPLVICFYFPTKFAIYLRTILFVIAGLTDYLDGWVARKYDIASDFGRFLDPIADKILVNVTLFLLGGFQSISPFHQIASLAIITREILISGMREFLALKQITVKSSKTAKLKTVFQMLALTFLLLSDIIESHIKSIGLILLWIAAALSIYSSIQYITLSWMYFPFQNKNKNGHKTNGQKKSS